ncbi:hypothetical protein [Natrinema pallidum]|uniref:Peptidase C39-like domain-containing protein n=1 Tax=Natrinema pallidum TaxID=69527 RepID=A0A4P9THJ2_9EURY|nr:hypothetical protein [Natrinema pallidum]QCW04366.1 hypothetical protein FGF80_14500 [Natrinema pallidum]
MTITEGDYEQYQETVDGFHSQQVPDSCLPTALKNILDEFAERAGESGLEFSLRQLNNICDYNKGMASTAEFVPERLEDKVGDNGYTAKVAINLDMSELSSIIDGDSSSYPIVELDPSYFDTIDEWDPRPGVDGRNWPHIIVPFKVNTDSVLYHDPFDEMMVRSSYVDNPKCEISIAEFYDLWSGQAQSRWTMWVQEKPQTTLDQIAAGDSSE